ncbi:MAG: uracil phosphoribosyltransferase [Bacteroidia bacterium]
MYKVLAHEHSLVNDFLAEIRDKSVQTDRARFRKNIERIGQIMAYEISKHLPRIEKNINTPLGTHKSQVLQQQPVLATILRAGLAMHSGFLNFFDHAESAFISAYRKHTCSHEFEIVVEYLASPNLNNRILILIDPMLATGQSIHLSYKALLTRGKPSVVYVAGLISSSKGIEYVQQHLPEAHIFVADVDNDLNNESYIVPGIGDAGDLCYGEKL